MALTQMIFKSQTTTYKYVYATSALLIKNHTAIIVKILKSNFIL
jgi:hypothetical protein